MKNKIRVLAPIQCGFSTVVVVHVALWILVFYSASNLLSRCDFHDGGSHGKICDIQYSVEMMSQICFSLSVGLTADLYEGGHDHVMCIVIL